MERASIVRYLNPWKLRREREAERLRALRSRDGDQCARCRRPLRFDLPDSHDQGARIEEIAPVRAADRATLDNLRLCHRRCNAAGLDHTDEVTERIRRKSEAALLPKSRKRARRAA
jgi:5-methylcytosine-specific restriction endonuclease McrA